MCKVLMTCVALLSVSAGPLLAQQAVPSGSAVDIPRPAGPSSTGAMPSASPAPDPGAVSSGGGMTGLRPMRGQPKQAVGMNHFTHKPPTPARSSGKRRGTPATHTSGLGNDGVSAPRPRDGAGGSASASSATARGTTTETL